MSHPGVPDSVPSRRDSSPKDGYTRLPRSVLRDASLSPWARLVYAELADWVRQGSVVRMGLRAIAANVGCGRGTVARAVAELVEHDLVDVRKRAKSRSYYILKHKVFGQKQGKVTEVGIGPSGGTRLVSIAEDVA